MKLHLSEQALTNYCALFHNDIVKNRTRNLTFIVVRPRLHCKYVLLCKKYCSLQKGGNEQDVESVESVESKSPGFIGAIADIVYKLAGNTVCKSVYPVHDKNMLPSSANTMRLLVSTAWNTTLSTGEFTESVMDTLDVITTAFGIFLTETGTPVMQIVKKGVNTLAKVGATAVSTPFGGFGSEVIAVPSVIAKAAHIIKTILNLIKKIYEKMKPIISKGVEIIRNAGEKLSNAREVLQKANYKMKEIDQFVDSDMMLRFMYDLFSVTFEGGTFQCKCWVDYILSTYIGKGADKKKASMLYCFLSNIYVEINNILLDFVGSAIEMLIPQLAGIVTFILGFGKKYSYIAYKQLLSYLVDKYHQSPSDLQLIMEDPNKLKEYVNKMYNSLLGASEGNMFNRSNYGFFSGLIVGQIASAIENLTTHLTGIDRDTVDKGIDLVGFAIHKCMGIIFAFLNLFVSFSEIYADAGDIEVEEDVKNKCNFEAP